MSKDKPVKFTGAGLMGMPKHAKRIWPFEEGMQPRFWEREEELARQYVSTSIAREVAMQEVIENIRDLYPPRVIQLCLDAYDIRCKEIYTAHSKAVHEIKSRYPGVK